MDALGLAPRSIDIVLTSPPYATALPYIDTDRLSLLLLYGLNASARRPLELGLIGSREIVRSKRHELEAGITAKSSGLPPVIGEYLLDLHRRLGTAKVGFRRQNMPALLLRFFNDISAVLKNCKTVLRRNGEAMLITGDNRIQVGAEYERIPTTDYVACIAASLGFEATESIDITVTTENLLHVKNAITQNVVLRLRAN
jgi:hypothetical protein